MATPALQQAISTLKTGKRAEAQRLLQEIIRSNPANERAWLWYIDTLPSNAERIQALKWCLRFNPNSDWARRGLNALNGSSQIAAPILLYQQEEKQATKSQKKESREPRRAVGEPLFSAFVRPKWENREFYWYWDDALFCKDCGSTLTQCNACGTYFCADCQSLRCIICGEPAITEDEEDELPRDSFSIFKLVIINGPEEDEFDYEEEYEEPFHEDRFDQEYMVIDEFSDEE